MSGHRFALTQARSLITALNGEIAPLPVSEEVLNPTVQHDLTLVAYPLEDMSSTYTVDYHFPDESNCSDLSFFQDGKQRTVQIGHIPATYGSNLVLIPFHFFVVAAVILQRVDGQLKVWGTPELQQGILVEKSLVPNQQILSEFEASGLSVIDTRGQGGDYYDLRRRALRESKKLRLQAEERLIAQWRASSEAQDNFLVVDGTLMNFRNEDNVERCVGVSKSFGSRYFAVTEHNRIMQMPEFDRSWAFRFHSPEDDDDELKYGARERISWYLRLRTRPNTEPEFGLVRVEISQRHADQAADYANYFSRSLLSERLPTSFPVPRWDKHLYPIWKCESYLSSVMPSIETINASMKG